MVIIVRALTLNNPADGAPVYTDAIPCSQPDSINAMSDSIRRKHAELSKRWGLDDLFTVWIMQVGVLSQSRNP